MKLLLQNIPFPLASYRDALEQCLLAFDKVAHVHEVRLFGSFARGDATSASDVDLCIVAEGAEHQLETAGRLRHSLRNIRSKPALTLVPISPARLVEKMENKDHFFTTVFEEGICLAAQD